MQTLWLCPTSELSAERFSIRELANIGSDTPEPLYQKSLQALAQWQHGDNQGALKTALSVPKPYTHATAWNLLGLAWMHMKDAVKAKIAFDHALDMNPDFHMARLNLATVLMTGGDFRDAEDHITQVLQDSPQHQEALLTREQLKRLQGEAL